MYKDLKLVRKDNKNTRKSIQISSKVAFSPDRICVIAGPCAVESYDQLLKIAQFVKSEGACIFRAGAYKPRTSPYSFQGLGDEGLIMLDQVRRECDIPVVTEILDIRDLDKIMECSDMIQVGTRNMQNFSLLKELGKVSKPILLKRGMMATIYDFLLAAEYILSQGNENVILCERGIRTFETYTRNTLDISAFPIIKQLSHLPIIVDPSHSSGRRELVSPLTLAALVAGADGVILETHHNPSEALSDGHQAVPLNDFPRFMQDVKKVAHFLKRYI